MITLLLTFFILLVALADTQTAGLVGAGKGPLVQHLNAKGEPAILAGRLNRTSLKNINEMRGGRRTIRVRRMNWSRCRKN